MLLRVQYPDFYYDYVDAATLDGLIVSKRITKFLRPSETLWVNVGQGPVRGAGGIYMETTYAGPERRQIPSAT
jgi:hypothetical protein